MSRDYTGQRQRAVFRLSFLVQGAALRAARGAVSNAAASARAGRAASGRSPRGARLLLSAAEGVLAALFVR